MTRWRLADRRARRSRRRWRPGSSTSPTTRSSRARAAGRPSARSRTAWRWSRRASTCSTSARWRPAAGRRSRPRRRRRGSSRRSRGSPAAPVCRSPPTPFSPRSRGGRSTPAPRRSTTSAAAPTRRCSSWSPSSGCGYVLMHIEGPPRADREPPGHEDPVAHLKRWFARADRGGARRGVAEEQIALDPGLDFDLSVDDDLEILRRLGELRELGRPLFVSLSRKDFLGAVLAGSWEERAAAAEREWATAAATALAVAAGRRDAAAPRPQRARRAARRRRSRRPPGSLGSPRRREWLAPAAGDSPPPRAGSARSSRGAPTAAWSPRASRRRERPRRVEIPASLAPELAGRPARAGIEALYSHQLEALRRPPGGNAIVTSGTASGKSLSFNLPVLDELARDDGRRALYLYPTKALAQDQARKLSAARPAAASPRDLRRRHAARRPARDPPPLEPDAHQPRHAQRRHPAPPQELGRLPRQPRLGRRRRGPHLPRRVRLARRQRAAAPAPGRRALYGAEPALHPRLGDDRQPGRARRAAGRRALPAGRLRRRAARRPADRDVEPAADRRALDDPALGPLRGRRAARRPGRRGGADDLLPAQPPRDRADPALHADAARGAGPRRARRADRPLPGRLHAAAAARDRGAAGGRRAARGGRHRRARARDRHRRARRGDLRHLPRHRRQPAADVGARGRRSEGLALYVAGQDALDQFFCRHPEEFLERPVEAAILDHENERIQLAHLLAAAYEVPLSEADADGASASAGASAPSAWSRSASCGAGREGRYLPRGPRFPAGDISLRSASADSVAVVERDSGELLGAVEAERAFTTVHPGAVYLHLGRSYEVRELDIEARRAVVDALRRRLVHAAEEGDRGLHRADRREARRSTVASVRMGSSSPSARSR